MLMKPIRLIVGLGNPGAQYDGTRHNAGADFVKQLADSHVLSFKKDNKLHGLYARIQNEDQDCHLLIPNTFMNCSGLAVRACANFFKIEPSAILVAHDDLDLPPGTIRLRQDGGHGGHNGIRDIISHLSTKAFCRLRIGIGHPGNKEDVTNFVLRKPSSNEKKLISDGIDQAIQIIPDLLSGKIQNAMQILHSPTQREKSTDGI